MLNFKKDEMALLQVLRDLVTDNLGYGDVNANLDSDVSDVIMELKDKRRLRRLRDMRRALDKFMKSFNEKRKSHDRERKFNESLSKSILGNNPGPVEFNESNVVHA